MLQGASPLVAWEGIGSLRPTIPSPSYDRTVMDAELSCFQLIHLRVLSFGAAAMLLAWLCQGVVHGVLKGYGVKPPPTAARAIRVIVTVATVFKLIWHRAMTTICEWPEVPPVFGASLIVRDYDQLILTTALLLSIPVFLSPGPFITGRRVHMADAVYTFAAAVMVPLLLAAREQGVFRHHIMAVSLLFIFLHCLIRLTVCLRAKLMVLWSRRRATPPAARGSPATSPLRLLQPPPHIASIMGTRPITAEELFETVLFLTRRLDRVSAERNHDAAIVRFWLGRGDYEKARAAQWEKRWVREVQRSNRAETELDGLKEQLPRDVKVAAQMGFHRGARAFSQAIFGVALVNNFAAPPAPQPEQLPQDLRDVIQEAIGPETAAQ